MELLVIWIVMGAVVAMIASSKGRSAGAWFFYGALIWPIALVHILLSPRPEAVTDARVMAGGEHRKCPYCAELVRREAIVCKHCGRDIGPDPAGAAPKAAPASETLPSPPIATGSRVVSDRHGRGTVLEVGPLALTVRFDRDDVQVVPPSSVRMIVEG